MESESRAATKRHLEDCVALPLTQHDMWVTLLKLYLYVYSLRS